MLTRKSGLSGSPATISAIRRAARSDMVTFGCSIAFCITFGLHQLWPGAANALCSGPILEATTMKIGRRGGLSNLEDAHGQGDDRRAGWGGAALGASGARPGPLYHPAGGQQR